MNDKTREMIDEEIGRDGLELMGNYYVEQINAGYRVSDNYLERESRKIAINILVKHQNYKYCSADSILVKRIIEEYEELAKLVEEVLEQEIKMELAHYANSFNTALKRLENRK